MHTHTSTLRSLPTPSQKLSSPLSCASRPGRPHSLAKAAEPLQCRDSLRPSSSAGHRFTAGPLRAVERPSASSSETQAAEPPSTTSPAAWPAESSHNGTHYHQLGSKRPVGPAAGSASDAASHTRASAASSTIRVNTERPVSPPAAVLPTVPPTDDATSVSPSVDDPDYDGIELQSPARPPGLYVRVRGMVKHFNTAKGVFRAVDGVDVDVEPSSITALLGPSGSGKTTLLRLVAGLETPTNGNIFFNDLDATDLTVQDRQIGFVFQSYALFNHKTVADNIKFGLRMRNLQVDHDKRASDLLELVQLTGLGDRYPRQLSGGQRQRVALARALASNPRLLLLDEPFGALDAVVRKELRTGLKEIVRSVGVTTIIVTHDQEEAFDLADKVVIFNRGLIEQQGTPTDIIRHPRTPFIMKFVGDTNIVPANCVLVRRSRFQTSKSKVMFRPSDVQVFKDYVAGEHEHMVTPAVVADKFNLGWFVRYVLRFDDDVEIELQVPREQDDRRYNMEPGRRIYLYVRPQAMMGFDPSEIETAPVVS